jgi:hypothetical protein
MAITYRKTKAGTWVAYGPLCAIQPGKTVTVAKRDGTTKQELIASIGRPFTANGQQMVYGYLTPKTQAHQPSTGTTCAECGERRGHVQRRDSSGIAGLVCGRCDRSADYELSFA